MSVKYLTKFDKNDYYINYYPLLNTMKNKLGLKGEMRLYIVHRDVALTNFKMIRSDICISCL